MDWSRPDRVILPGRSAVALAVCAIAAAAVPAAGPSRPPGAQSGAVRASIPFIDAHAHLDGPDAAAAARSALEAAERENADAVLLLPPPRVLGDPRQVDAEALLPAAREHPGRLAVLGGGGTLNAMIQESAASGTADAGVRRRFSERAEQLLRDGVVGFGELAAEHFAGQTPYQSAPADHPLFLLLADIAARHRVPIVLHLEAVPEEMPLPPGLGSPPNPPRLRENLAGFERLLAHQPLARIIWAHAGADGTGHRTPALCRRLLQAHPNLSMEIKVDPEHPGTNPLLAEGVLRPEWRALFVEFPDRFLIGSDQHYPEPAGAQQRWQAAVLLLNQLPAEVRRQVGTGNARRLYALPAARGTEGR